MDYRLHKSVLLQESILMLDIKPTDVVVDATVGGAGHSSALASHLGESGVLIGLDVDSQAIESAQETLIGVKPTIHLKVENFRNLGTVLQGLSIKAADKYLFDLGWSSIQLESSGRGLSFQKDEPLLMTLSDKVTPSTLTAGRIVNEWSEEQIRTIIHSYADERFAKRIAEAIVRQREISPIATTKELADLILAAVPGWYRNRKTHPATKTFQALRITVNDELDALQEGLRSAQAHLSTGGRIAVISFHSMEDRIVKRMFREWEKEGQGKILTKKPMTPSREEQQENPRSRSAKLRIFENNVTNSIT